jgi:protein-disulfide isomerase
MVAGQADLSGPALERMAAQAGVDLVKARSTPVVARAETRIQQDMAQASQVGANGTPAMFFNCRYVSGALPFETLRAVAEEELKKAEALLARGERRGPAFYGKACQAAIASAPAAPSLTLRPDDPARGSPGAPITLTLFSDFQCPYCSRVEPTLAQVEAAYPGKVRIVWKHKPLSFHNNALPAAVAAEAAREQGKFWPMHDKLFAGQKELSPEAYERWAAELGLDMARFRASIAAGKGRARVEEDDALSSGLGVSGTPQLFVNGEKLQAGAIPFEAIKAAIDRKLTATR